MKDKDNYCECTIFQARPSAKHVIAIIPFIPDRNVMVTLSTVYR